MTKTKQMPSVTIVGFGSLGMSLAVALRKAGISIDEIIVRPKTLSKSANRARQLGARLSSLPNATLNARVVWICTPDDVIQSVAGGIRGRLSREQIMLHSSGALGSKILLPQAPSKRDWPAVASAHPMMTFTRNTTTSLEQVIFALEGDRKATRLAAGIISQCGGESFQISSAHKTLYHVFGSACSPLIVALLLAGEEIARAARVPKSQVKRLSRPIIMRTIENYFANGAREALSGPLRRGDIATIQRHLDALAAMPELKDVYSALSRLAMNKLSVQNRQQLKKLLTIC